MGTDLFRDWICRLGTLPSFPLGYFCHLSTFKEHYEGLEIYREPVIIPLGLASMLVQGLVFAWVYPRLFSTARSEWLGSALIALAWRDRA